MPLRETPKKKVGGESSNSLLNFFRKTDGGSTSNGDNVPRIKVEEEVSWRIGKDVGKPKGKMFEHGSEVDPVVISDDEDPIDLVDPKRRKVSLPLNPSNSMEVDVSSTRPSHLPRQSCPPPPAPPPVTRSDPFPNLPAFKPPSTWPDIVNTADVEVEVEADIDGDGSVREMVSDDGKEPHDPGDGTNGIEKDDYGLQMPMDDVPEIMQSTVPLPRRDSTSSKKGWLGGDFDMVWDEPEDEGMGMEEDGDDGASEIVETPPPVKRNRGEQSDKVSDCPICGKSLKGKTNNVCPRVYQ